MQPRHLVYEIDTKAHRSLFYESYWKTVALKLVLRRSGDLNGAEVAGG